MNVAGLDLSTTRIGYASTDGRLHSITVPTGAEDPIRRLYELRRALDRAIALFPPRPELVVIEDYSLGSPGRLSLVRLGEIGGIARVLIFEKTIPIALVAPTSLKKYATGRGDASKDDMIAEAVRRGATPRNHDEADAFLLRQMGLDGTAVPT